jgi:nucleoid DNA-binding protein
MDESSKKITVVDINKEVYKLHPFPLYIVEKIVASFFTVLEKHMLKGDYILLSGLGTLVPYRKHFGIRGWKNYDPSRTRVRYKMKLSTALASKVAKKTTRRNDVQGSQD